MTQTPKHQILREYILGQIGTGAFGPGMRIPSENELAERFHFSRHTVRHAIGELTAEGCLIRIHGKGTYVSQAMVECKTIGILTTYLTDYIFPAILRGIDERLSARGYAYMLNCTFNDWQKERSALQSFLALPISGLIVEPTRSALPNPNLDLYQALRQKGVKLLFIHGSYGVLDAPYIAQDDAAGGQMAAEYLLTQGFRRIGGIFKANDIQGLLRCLGMESALQQRGNPCGAEDILWFDDYTVSPDGLQLYRDYDQEGSTSLIRKKQSKAQIRHFFAHHDAVLLYNEVAALSAMEIIKKYKLVIPRDIAIVTFDDSEIARAVGPKLTTIAHPKEELGRIAADTMLDMLQKREGEFLSVKIKPRLIARDSGILTR